MSDDVTVLQNEFDSPVTSAVLLPNGEYQSLAIKTVMFTLLWSILFGKFLDNLLIYIKYSRSTIKLFFNIFKAGIIVNADIYTLAIHTYLSSNK